jgi:7-carboxy-7-deazaguanine synthase
MPHVSNLKYKVNEVFTTIQGEGRFTGHPAVFIRLQGCDVGCGFCDTKYTWDDKEDAFTVSPDEIFAKTLTQTEEQKLTWAFMTLEQLFDYVETQKNVKLVVITGGEPCLQVIHPLIEALEATHRVVQIETSGTEPVDCTDKTWVTVSPKIQIGNMKPIISQAIERANEIKFVCGAEAHLAKLDELLATHKTTARIYLQPLSILPKATQLCVDVAIKRGWHVSIQTHKYINVR